MSPGSGRGAITADGCAVEVYLRLPHLGEADLIHAAIPRGATVLDLGCGVGRIAHPLLELGHPVTAVDSSDDMLAHVRGAETVQASIAELELGRRFDAVLLASHLVNTADDAARAALLRAAARHLAPHGVLVAECHPPAWFAEVHDGAGGWLGEVQVEVADVRRHGEILAGTVRYRLGDEAWTQPFDALRLDEAGLRGELAAAGLSFERWLRADQSWFRARPATPA
jgi:SAM-dependent methyltransferase